MTKICTKCKKEKPLDEFNILSRSKDGKSCACKECHNKRNRKYYSNPKVKKQHASAHLRKRYGLTVEDYDKKLNEQDGKCALCGKHWSTFKKRLHVDHNHITGKIRGLLCAGCNTRLEPLEDLDFAKRAQEYLQVWYEDI